MKRVLILGIIFAVLGGVGFTFTLLNSDVSEVTTQKIIQLLQVADISDNSQLFAKKMPKVEICHRTGAEKYVHITVSGSAVPAHMDHGDAPEIDGLCPDENGYGG